MYVFLDFDGVLNSSRYLMSNPRLMRMHMDRHLVFDPEAMGLLNILLMRLPAEVVISSDWRKARSYDVLAQRMVRDGFLYPEKVVDQTPDFGDVPRGREINAWLLARNKRGKPFVVLDDRSDMNEVDSHHVKIDPVLGLTKADVNKATLVLGRGKKKAR